MRSRRGYDEAFREDALRLLKRGDRGITVLAKDLGVPASTLDYWYKADMAKKAKRPARSPGTPSARGSNAETPEEKIARLEREVAKLEKRNAELEMDRAILKKAAAFFAKESE